MEEQTPRLKPSDLYAKRQSKDAARLRAYNKILDQVFTRIRTISKLPNSQCYLLYTVPPFILGLPKIDMEDCVVYLVYQLRQSGFEVRYTAPNLLYISWAHHEKSYLLEKSPILQAMLQTTEENNKKQKTKSLFDKKPSGGSKKVKFSDTNNYSVGSIPASSISATRQAAINTVLSAGPPRLSASEYTPPSSFLKSMQSPGTSQQNSDKKTFSDYLM
jgi:hypothetical protein